MEKPVTTASVPIQKLPMCRLTEAVEFVEPKLDVTLTATLDLAVLSVIMWDLTRLKPDMKISELRCTTYLELWLRMRCAAERYKNLHESEVKAYIEGALCAEDLREYVLDHAIQQGFDPAWLDTEKKTKAPSQKAVAQRTSQELSQRRGTLALRRDDGSRDRRKRQRLASQRPEECTALAMYPMTRRHSDRILEQELQELEDQHAEMAFLEEESENQTMAADEAA